MVGKLLQGRYEVLDRIGQGGMALVYRGRDVVLNRRVAIKVLRRQFADDPRVVEDFHLEARAAASLDGPHVVLVYDVGAEDDAHYIVMELVEGQNLKDYLAQKGPLDPSEAVGIALQIADALAQAHARHIIHRDIKPQNILIAADGTVKVTDFGIARAMAGGTLVNTGSLIGTAQYLSPEQARGKAVGPATDLYGLGVVLFEMLTGAPPFAGDSPIAVALRHVQEPVPDVRERRPDVPESVARLVSRLLQKDPADRFPSAAAFQEQARQVLAGVVPADDTEAARPAPERHPAPAATAPAASPGRGKRRARWPWLAALVVVLAIVAGGAVMAGRWLAGPAPRAVPKVVGLTLAEARNRLKRAGFSPVWQGNVPSATIPRGRVTSESPGAGVRLKPGALIGLLVSSGPFRVMVPSLKGEGQAMALQQLATMHLKGRLHTVNNGAPAGQVVSQEPAAGTMLAEGSWVTLNVSNGRASTPTAALVPNVTGLGTSAAAAALAQVNMMLGGLTYSYSTLPANTVIDQDPPPFSPAVANGGVNLVISKGVSPASQGQPENQNLLDYSIPFTVNPGSVLKVVVQDTAGNMEVYYEQVGPGQQVSIKVTWYGTSAQETTYLNGQQQGAPEPLSANGGNGPGAGPNGAPGANG
jgi:beta-lactam-binding protein with PASTA domain/tRNA A-37 threonylcarbamoyl transferase component Bud32